jgi:hypothetical protein
LNIGASPNFVMLCKRYRYIGLCYGSPGVGKTLSARHYANRDNVQAYWNHQRQSKALLKEISKGTVAFYTSPVVSLPNNLEETLGRVAVSYTMPQSNARGGTNTGR